uniref:Uncharacterized protein n=1 Tax=Rhizophora mucronata TaxID=61149 RepID=A0A2P2MD04_RHIMU
MPLTKNQSNHIWGAITSVELQLGIPCPLTP